MNLDELLEEWDLYCQTLRKPNSDLFQQMLEEVKEYKDAILIQAHRPTEALLMALALRNQKTISELIKRRELID